MSNKPLFWQFTVADGIEQLSEPMLSYCHLERLKQTSVTFYENLFEYVVLKMAATLLRHRYASIQYGDRIPHLGPDKSVSYRGLFYNLLRCVVQWCHEVWKPLQLCFELITEMLQTACCPCACQISERYEIKINATASWTGDILW